MNRLRTHIVRIIVLVLIWTGFSLYMVQSARAEYSSHAFARWFSTMLSASQKADLQKQLNELRESNDHLDKVLEKASKIVRRNNEEFTFPFAKAAKTRQVYQLLLFEWNQFQTENTMAGVPVQQTVTVKSLVPIKVDKSGACSTATEIVKAPRAFLRSEVLLPNSQSIAVSLVPMSSGIAIGAP